MRVDGRINPGYYYYVAVNATGNRDYGPVPTADASGNGWGTSDAPGADKIQGLTHYIEYGPNVPGPGYGVYRFQDSALQQGEYLGRPADYTVPSSSSGTLWFAIDLSQLGETSDNRILEICVNLIATNRILPDGGKLRDGLGPDGTTYLARLPTGVNTTYQNAWQVEERDGDVLDSLGRQVGDPDLDIIDWKIEVRGNK